MTNNSVDWSQAAPAVQSASVSLIAMLVAAFIVLAAIAWYSVVAGRNRRDDD